MITYYYSNHTRHDPGLLNNSYISHDMYTYWETARRGNHIYQAVGKAALGPILSPQDYGLKPISAVHSAEFINILQTAFLKMATEIGSSRSVTPNKFLVNEKTNRIPNSIIAQLGVFCSDINTPIFEHTWDAAYWSAQTAVSAASSILDGCQTSYALCRPPGHHASSSVFGGFCYLNNAAIAAQWLKSTGLRVAILDLDIHHGNGTQQIFYASDAVLFCSIHVDPSHKYPYYWGYSDEIGIGPGEGYNHNYPLPLFTDDFKYLETLSTALKKVKRFSPDIILVSLGLDTLKGDPIGGFMIQLETYTQIGAKIASLNMPVVVVQEGGYLLDSLGEGVVEFLKGLLNG